MATQFPRQGPGPGNLPIGGQQQGLHPTVTYGQPGGQQAVVIPPGQPMPGEPSRQQMNAGPMPQMYGNGYDPSMIPPAPNQQQPQQQYAQYQQPQGVPTPNQGWQSGQGMPQQPQLQGPAQPQQQAPVQQQAVAINPNVVLDGPNVPPELRGRTWGQAMQIYNGLATAYARTAGFQQPLPTQQPTQQAPVQQAPTPRQWNTPAGAAQQHQAAGFWEENRNIIREEVQQALRPVVQQSYAQGVDGARAAFRQNVSDAAIVEGEVMAQLAGAPPEALANPEVWSSAADLVRGKMIREGRYQQPQQQGVPQFQGNGRQVPAGMQPLPQYTFFSEQPTPGMQGLQGGGVLTPQQQWAANAMGMDATTYLAWAGGIQR